MWDPYAELQKFQLSNGLTVYLGTWDRPWLKAGIVVHSGARNDPDDRQGLAHFLEHLVSENMQAWTSETARQFFQRFGGTAGFGSTSYSDTTYGFSVPLEGDNLAFALNLFGHMLMDCEINQFIERERQVIIREYTKRFPMSWMADRVLKRRQLLFPGTKLANYIRPLGTPKSILSISKDEIQAFYDRYYTPANMTIVAVGDIKPDEFATMLEGSPFGLEKPGVRTPLANAIRHFNPPIENRLIHKVSDYSLQVADQSAIECFAAIPGDVKPKVLARVSNVLGDILYNEIREERGWTYGFGTVRENYCEAYEFCIQGAFPWEGLAIIEDLIDECLARSIKDEDRIRHHIHSSVMGYKITDIHASEVIEGAMNDLRLYHRIKPLMDERDESADITVEEVKEGLMMLSRDRRWTVIMHP
jgi:zinc protease